MTLRVSAYEFPEKVSGTDANWLTGEVELTAGSSGAFSARHSVFLLTDELASFRNKLRELVESMNGSATLNHLESQLGATVELRDGRGNLTAVVREHVGSELRVHQCETDQSYLAQTLRELDALLNEFPVRGNPD